MTMVQFPNMPSSTMPNELRFRWETKINYCYFSLKQVARLAKYWNSTIFFPGRISGRSSIFELIGITAGREEEKNSHSPSIVNAFERFLKKVATLMKQRISYYVFYDEKDVPSKVSKKTPLILDPSSPYNNFMFGFQSKAMKLLMKCANESLEMFKTDVMGSIQMHQGRYEDPSKRKKKRKRKNKKVKPCLRSYYGT